MKKILFPTDFTDTSFNAVKYGLSLFKDEPCEIYLLNTFQVPTFESSVSLYLPSNTNMYDDKIKESFLKLRNEIANEFPNNRFIIKDYYKLGDLTNSIEELITTKDINLIVIGTNTISNDSNLLFGSHSSSIILNVKCPVLAIPTYALINSPKNIAIAVDNKYDINKYTIRPLTDIARKFNAEIFIIHISNSNKMNKNFDFDGLDNYFKNLKCSYRNVYDFDISNGIESFVKNNDISMIGVLTHKMNFIKQIFHSSVSRKLVSNGKMPVFSINLDD